MKSDFVRAVAQDETVKTQIGEDMYQVPNDLPLVEDDTGEIVDDVTTETEVRTDAE